MKNRVIGILIALFFIAVAYVLEAGSIVKLLAPSPLLIVFGPAIGLTIAHYRKGMDKTALLKKLKKYLIFFGCLGTLIGLIVIFGATPKEVLLPEDIFRKLSADLLPLFHGLLAAYIVDAFIYE